VLLIAVYIRHLTEISEKLSNITTSNSADETPLSTELLLVDVDNLSSESSSIKAIRIFISILTVSVELLHFLIFNLKTLS